MVPRRRDARRTPARLASLTGAVAAGLTLLGAAPVAADDLIEDDSAAITHIEVADERLRVLVSVPAGAQVDLDGVSAQVGDAPADATAEPAGKAGQVLRTVVLAIDTSDSMRGARAEAARAAALAFLDTAPDDVRVGVVTFDGTVETPLEPTSDRGRAREVIEGLELARGTRLHDAITTAIEVAGSEGQRSVLVLSDGADTTDTPLSEVTAALEEGDVLLDVVALEEQGETLATLAEAGRGKVVSADPEALTAAFAEEADALERQVLVTVTVPDDVGTNEATVAVALPTDGAPLTASAYTTVRARAPAAAEPSALTPVVATTSGGLDLPVGAMYAGVVAIGVALLLLLLVMVPAKPQPLGAAERVEAYLGAPRAGERRRQTEAPSLAPVREAASRVLSRNRGMEEKIALRLEGAGSELRPAEWLMLHAGIVVATTLLGLLLGGVLVGTIGLALGAVGPRVYLNFRRSRRRKAFNASLPDALQLMSGALEAGLSLPQATDSIVKEGIEPIASEFRRALVETRLGVDLEDALEGVADRLESEDLGWVVMAIRIQRPIGGNLAELLGTVAATMREREYMRRQVAALAAEGKLSAWVLGGLPPGFLVYLLLTNRDYVMPLFTTPMGLMMLGGAATILAVGVFWMSKLVKVEV